jgi:hypothetical protein
MIVKPREGLRVLRPDTKRPLPPEGIEVPDGDRYWTRREAQGDVEVTAAPEVAAEPEPAKE